MRLYYAQRTFKKQRSYYATSLGNLQMPEAPAASPDTAFTPRIVLQGDGFVASVVYPDNDGIRRTLHISDDSRLW